jgi:two-component system, NarL family, response regulator LiaR
VGAISVLVVDDHALFAEALQARLSQEPDLHPVSVACTAAEARVHLASSRPAVAILDVALGNESGIRLAGYIRETSPATSVVMLTAVESVDSVVSALSHGARAWLPKTVDTDHLIRVIRGVICGEAWLAPDLLGGVLTKLLTPAVPPAPDPLAGLTARERQVLQCMVDGLSRAEIAVRLHLSANTVRTHTQNLLGKLGAHSTLESVALALRHGVRASGMEAGTGGRRR